MTEQKKGFKEDFAKFFENPDRVKFRDLIKNNTGEYNHIDFKGQWLEGTKLAKHILGFANSKGGILVFGIRENTDKTLVSKGLEELKDKTQVISGIKSYLPTQIKFEVLDFSFTEAEYADIKDKKFQVLIVEDTPDHLPFLSMRDGEGIKKNVVYYRGSVNTDQATYEQLQEIINRRIDTGYSTTKEMEFRTHLNQLNDLYGVVSKYSITAPWLSAIAMPSMFQKERNPKYPDEDFEDFILRMIQKKKLIIDGLISGKGV